MSDGRTDAYRMMEDMTDEAELIEQSKAGRKEHYRDAIIALITNLAVRGDMINAAKVVDEYQTRFSKGDFWAEAIFYCWERL